jgi:hypothetical protein
MVWVHAGRVPYIRIGRKYLFNRELLNDFLKGRTNEPPSGTTMS